MLEEAEMRHFSTLVVAVLFTVASASAQTGAVIRAGETHRASTDLICRTPDDFARVVADAAQAKLLQRQVELLESEVTSLRKALEAALEADKHRQEAVVALERKAEVYRELAEAEGQSWDQLNKDLVRERKKNGPWFVSGPVLGLGLAHDGETADMAGFVGWGVAFNVTGRR